MDKDNWFSGTMGAGTLRGLREGLKDLVVS